MTNENLKTKIQEKINTFSIIKNSVREDYIEYLNETTNEETRDQLVDSINSLNTVINEMNDLEKNTTQDINVCIRKIKNKERTLERLKEKNKKLTREYDILKGSNNAYDERTENIYFVFRRNLYVYGIFLLGTFVTSGILIKLIRE